MPTFDVKKVTVPLFGVVDAANKTAWLSAFAESSASTQVKVDESALKLLSEELELDADCLAADAERYVSGHYRLKARGLGGSRLGDLGELLTFLMYRAADSTIVRVVSWRAGANQPVQGSRFPQPDFIVTDKSGSAAALEVKSTEAFDFIALRDTSKKWTWLQPCSSVAHCREQALPQLAYVAPPTPQKHSLVLHDKTLVPFPVGQGVAVAVLAVDGRTSELRDTKKFKTPPVCLHASRDCWSCIPPTCHFVLVNMPNAPGRLALAGAGSGGSGEWARAYQRWSQALAARDVFAVRRMVDTLAETVTAWLASPGIAEPDMLRDFWGLHLQGAMRSRGLDVEVHGQHGSLSRSGLEPSEPLAEPASREASLDDIARAIDANQQTIAPIFMSTRLQNDNQSDESRSVTVSGEFVEFRFASNSWWTSDPIETTENASAVATRLLAVACNLSGLPMPAGIGGVPLREVVAHVGEQTVHLGWETKAATPAYTTWWAWMQFSNRLLEFDPWFWPAWPMYLALGDPRIRLTVRRDGLAKLRVQRPLLQRR